MHHPSKLSLLVNPYQTLTYFANYYALVTQTCIWKNVEYIRLIRLFNRLLLVTSFRYLFLALIGCSSDEDPQINLCHAANFDVWYSLISKTLINLWIFELAFLYYYTNCKILLHPDYQLLQVLRAVLLRKNWRVALKKPTWRRKSICDQLRKLYLILLNVMLSSMVLFAVLLLIHYFMFMRHIYMNLSQFDSNWKIALTLLLSHLSCLHCAACMLNYAHTSTLTFTPLYSLLYIFFAQMKQNYQLLCRLAFKRFHYHSYIEYRTLYQRSLHFLFAINRMYSKLFLGFLLGYCPMQVYSTILLLKGSVSPITSVTLPFGMVYFCNFLFAIHLLLAMCTKHIHRPVRLLFHLIACNQNNGKIVPRTRINLLLNLYAVHTKKRYGFTYGDFGLVTMMAFVKYLLLYGEYMMTTYQLMRS